MTSVPYPTFEKTVDRQSLAAVGRCRIQPSRTDDAAFDAIVEKCIQQGEVDAGSSACSNEEAKKLQKKYMKQGVSLAAEYLQTNQSLDVSVVDVEILLSNDIMIATVGCLASCFLDAGCARIVLALDDSLPKAIAAARIPRERLMVHVSCTGTRVSGVHDVLQSVFDQVRDDCSSVSFYVGDENNVNLQETLQTILDASKSEVAIDVVVQFRPRADCIKSLAAQVAALSTSTLSNTNETTISLIDPTAEQLGNSYAACLKTDRQDGLYSTVVCTRSGEALGLVYSSTASIVAALECGRGVYYSRSRNGLWRKGDTSGHYQSLHRIDVDCDGDALRYTVTQRCTADSAAAFCHLETLTCWGAPRGLRHLEETLRERRQSAPEGSYTKRLFEDGQLLQEKLVEEAQELAEADTANHVAEELADVLYFAMVKAANAGVSIDDAAAELDRRARKVTRRQGDSKAYRIEAGKAILENVGAKQEE